VKGKRRGSQKQAKPRVGGSRTATKAENLKKEKETKNLHTWKNLKILFLREKMQTNLKEYETAEKTRTSIGKLKKKSGDGTLSGQ